MDHETRQTLVEASRPVRWAAAAALGMLAIFLLVATFDALARFGEGDTPQVNTITVTGEGRSSATPDIAKVTFTVEENASTVAAAQDAATKRGNDAIAAMGDFGVADKDVKTLSYNVVPQYESQQNPCPPGALCPAVMRVSNKIIGYQVSQTVEVTIRDTGKAGDVLQKLGGLGVQNVSGPNFMVDDDEGVMNEARADAIANAREKAKELAKELGVSLGDVVSYSDQGMVFPYQAYAKGGAALDAAAPAPSLPVGTDERTVTVSVTYRIR